MTPVFVELRAITREFMAKLDEAIVEIDKIEKHGGSSLKKFGAIGKAALLGVATASISVGLLSLHMADQVEASHARLAVAVTNTGQHMSAWATQIAAVNAGMENLGYTNAETEQALGTLVTSTHNVRQSLGLMATAADLARFKGIALNDAAFMLSRALQGNSRVLKQLGVDLPVNAKSAESLKVAQHNLLIQEQQYQVALEAAHAKKKITEADLARLRIQHEKLAFAEQQVAQATHAHTLILDALSRKIHGQATGYADTFAGKLQIVKARTEDLAAKLGLALIPVIEKVVGWVLKTVDWLEKHKTVALALAGVVGGVLVAAIGAAAVEFVTASVAIGASEIAMAPIVLVAAAIGAAVLLLATHWTQAWDFIKRIVNDARAFIEKHAKLIGAALVVLLGPLGLLIVAAVELATHWHSVWSSIKNAVHDAWTFLRPIFTFVWNTGLLPIRLTVLWLMATFIDAWRVISVSVQAAWTILRPIFDALLTAYLWVIRKEIGVLMDAWSLAWTAIKAVVLDVWSIIGPILHTMLDVIGKVVGAVGKVGGFASKVGGGIFSGVKHFLGFAAGTDYAPGGVALVGEQGPELVNLPRGSRVTPNNRLGNGGGATYVVQFNGPVYGADADELARKVHAALLRQRSRGVSMGLA